MSVAFAKQSKHCNLAQLEKAGFRPCKRCRPIVETSQQRLMAIRMHHTRTGLLTTTDAIDKIGASVGLSIVSYFIKKYKEYFGQIQKNAKGMMQTDI